jgi:deoxyribose-phosphate aldolase
MNLANDFKQALAEKLISLLDLTSLNDSDTDATIIKLCKDAQTPLDNVAAVCVFPKFVALAKKELAGTDIKIATVANFPTGDEDEAVVLDTVKKALHDGADEIDLVIRFKDYLKGTNKTSIDLIKKCRKVCGDNIVLKTILETGALKKPELIRKASMDAIAAGSDFLKTSTGKVPIGATPEAASVMLETILDAKLEKRGLAGLKVSGGVKTFAQALEYMALVAEILGDAWIDPISFRIGASSLLQDILNNCCNASDGIVQLRCF